jgi:hypothetical protein
MGRSGFRMRQEVRYTREEKLEAVIAAIHQEHRLLPYVRKMDTKQECRALYGHTRVAGAARMGRFRGRVRRLERAADEEMIVIPQKDGTVRRFPQSAAKDAFLNLADRMGAGEYAPPEHPMIEAVRNTSDPVWAKTFYVCEEPDEWVKPIKNLSEP